MIVVWVYCTACWRPAHRYNGKDAAHPCTARLTGAYAGESCGGAVRTFDNQEAADATYRVGGLNALKELVLWLR